MITILVHNHYGYKEKEMEKGKKNNSKEEKEMEKGKKNTSKEEK